MKTIAKITLMLLFSFQFTQAKCQTRTIQPDKVKHFVAGGLVSAGTQFIATKLGANNNASLLIGFGAGVVVGVAKELYDMTGRGTPDFKDALWTGLGAGLTSVSLRFTIYNKQKTSQPTF